MDVDRLILEFERKLVLQRYSANSIANYKSSARSFLDLAKRKFSHPAEIDELAVEKYVLWKIERHRIGSSHQRMIVASIDKFYKSIYGRELKIKHLYPSRRTFALPNCLNIDEVKRIIDGTENIKHRCMIKMLYGSGLRLSELINLEIHLQSKRADKPFEVVDCGTLSAELAVSALFGHERGAFTSADAARKGYFELAAGGTLFLDEIGNLPKDVQAMLLRVLQSKSYRPLGATKDKVADVRIIAATNENLQEAVREGRFRSDLYYRLHEAVIEIPRLRDCKEDIMPLANFFLKLYDRHTDKEIKCISKEAQRALVSHTWPGNVRELKSCIMRAMLLCENEIIDVEDLQLSQSALTEEALDFDEQERKINRERILWALKQCNGIKRDAAKMLEMSHTTFYARMKEYGISTNKL